MNTHFKPALAVLALLFAGCGGDDDEPDAITTASPAPTATHATTGGNPAAWCTRWWEMVVEEENENSAVGALFLLVQEGVDVDDQVISSRSAVLDYRSGVENTAAETEQAIDDINLACSVYLAIDE